MSTFEPRKKGVGYEQDWKRVWLQLMWSMEEHIWASAPAHTTHAATSNLRWAPGEWSSSSNMLPRLSAPGQNAPSAWHLLYMSVTKTPKVPAELASLDATGYELHDEQSDPVKGITFAIQLPTASTTTWYLMLVSGDAPMSSWQRQLMRHEQAAGSRISRIGLFPGHCKGRHLSWL